MRSSKPERDSDSRETYQWYTRLATRIRSIGNGTKLCCANAFAKMICSISGGKIGSASLDVGGFGSARKRYLAPSTRLNNLVTVGQHNCVANPSPPAMFYRPPRATRRQPEVGSSQPAVEPVELRSRHLPRVLLRKPPGGVNKTKQKQNLGICRAFRGLLVAENAWKKTESLLRIRTRNMCRTVSTFSSRPGKANH